MDKKALGIDDPSNIAGMSALLDTADVKSGFDIQAFEKSITQGGLPLEQKKSVHHDTMFDEFLRSTAPAPARPERPQQSWRVDGGMPGGGALDAPRPGVAHDADPFGLGLGGDPFELSKDNFLSSHTQSFQAPSVSDEIDQLLKSIGGDQAAATTTATASTAATASTSPYGTAPQASQSQSSQSSQYDSLFGTAYSTPYGGSGFATRQQPRIADPFFTGVTEEETRRKIVENALSGFESSVDTAKARDEDTKMILIDSITSKRQILADEGEEIKHLVVPTASFSIQELKEMDRSLGRRLDLLRSGALGEDLMMLIAHGVEHMFDGKKSYFGFTPDMTDWHKTVQGKLRRNRADTSQMIDGMIREHGLGYFSRMALDLGPSAILYSRMRKNMRNDNLVSDEEFSRGLHQLQERKG